MKLNSVLTSIVVMVLLAACVIGMVDTATADDCPIGDGLLYQNWYAASCNKCEDCETIPGKDPLKTINGTVVGIRANTDSGGCPDPDQDWNIFVVPDPEFDWVLKNRDGVRNHLSADVLCGITVESPFLFLSEVGKIELEVKTTRPPDGADLTQYFPPGEHVTAKGYWVEDAGHEDKTELHPLVSLLAGNDDYQTILVTQDKSDRFVTDEWPIFESFDLNLGKRLINRIFPAFS